MSPYKKISKPESQTKKQTENQNWLLIYTCTSLVPPRDGETQENNGNEFYDTVYLISSIT